MPMQLPAIRANRFLAGSVVNFATCFWFSVMMISSPGANRWISSFKWACASSIVTLSDMFYFFASETVYL
jgi:hypothetical protein